MSAIDDLKRKVQSLEDQLSAAKKSLSAAIVAEIPFAVGDRVAEIDTGEEGIVRRVYSSFGQPKVEVAKLKKDGTPHKVHRLGSPAPRWWRKVGGEGDEPKSR